MFRTKSMVRLLWVFCLVFLCLTGKSYANESPAPVYPKEFSCMGDPPNGKIEYIRTVYHLALYRWSDINPKQVSRMTLYLKVQPFTSEGEPTSATVIVGLGTNHELEYREYQFEYDKYLAIPIPDVSNRVNSFGQFEITLKSKGFGRVALSKEWAYLVYESSDNSKSESDLKIDTDGDGLTDQQEKEGWDITIYNCRTEEVVSRSHVTSDYAKKDTDGDGLSDYQEYYKSNPTKIDTDEDGITDKSDEILNGIENEIPKITNFTYSSKFAASKQQITIRLKAEDQGSISNISKCIVSVGPLPASFKSKAKEDGDFNQTYEFSWAVENKADELNAEIRIIDRNGNLFYEVEELKSWAELVKKGMERKWDGGTDLPYKMPRHWQGSKNLSSACSLLEIAQYYSIADQNLETLKAKSGASDLQQGVNHDQGLRYLQSIGVFDKEMDYFPLNIQSVLSRGRGCPIYAVLNNYLGTNKDHAIVIVGASEDYIIVQDSDEGVTSYILQTSYVKSHLKYLFLTRKPMDRINDVLPPWRQP